MRGCEGAARDGTVVASNCRRALAAPREERTPRLARGWGRGGCSGRLHRRRPAEAAHHGSGPVADSHVLRGCGKVEPHLLLGRRRLHRFASRAPRLRAVQGPERARQRRPGRAERSSFPQTESQERNSQGGAETVSWCLVAQCCRKVRPSIASARHRVSAEQALQHAGPGSNKLSRHLRC